MKRNAEVLVLGVSNYVVVSKLSWSIIPNNKATGPWLVYFATGRDNIQLISLGRLEKEVKIISFILNEPFIRDLEAINEIVRNPKIRIIHTTGLYMHKGILRCELACFGLTNDSLNMSKIVKKEKKINFLFNVHKVPTCEFF